VPDDADRVVAEHIEAKKQEGIRIECGEANLCAIEDKEKQPDADAAEPMKFGPCVLDQPHFSEPPSKKNRTAVTIGGSFMDCVQPSSIFILPLLTRGGFPLVFCPKRKVDALSFIDNRRLHRFERLFMVKNWNVLQPSRSQGADNWQRFLT
jgi:hypothetical protein